MNSFKIRKATKNDVASVIDIVKTSNLPIDGIADHIDHYLIAEYNGSIVGTIGLEIYNNTGLLRSAAVLTNLQNQGIGSKLYNIMLDYAKEQGVNELILLTTSAEHYFQRKGFVPIDRTKIRGEVLSSTEFTGACPSDAVCMYKKL